VYVHKSEKKFEFEFVFDGVTYNTPAAAGRNLPPNAFDLLFQPSHKFSPRWKWMHSFIDPIGSSSSAAGAILR
jgi:hypothetical protein